MVHILSRFVRRARRTFLVLALSTTGQEGLTGIRASRGLRASERASEVDALQQQLAKLAEEGQRLQQRLEAAEESAMATSELQRQCGEQAAEVERLQAELEGLQEQQRQQRQAAMAGEATLQELQGQVVAGQADVEQLRQQLAAATERLAAQDTELQASQTQLNGHLLLVGCEVG